MDVCLCILHRSKIHVQYVTWNWTCFVGVHSDKEPSIDFKKSWSTRGTPGGGATIAIIHPNMISSNDVSPFCCQVSKVDSKAPSMSNGARSTSTNWGVTWNRWWKKGPVVFMKWMVAKGCFFFAYFNFYIIVYTDYVEIIYCMCICHSMYMWDSILLLRW